MSCGCGPALCNDCSECFGLQRTVAKGVLKKLHTHAILCLHNIIKERRYLENNGIYALQAGGNRRNNAAG